jgi:hypothetical protein
VRGLIKSPVSYLDFDHARQSRYKVESVPQKIHFVGSSKRYDSVNPKQSILTYERFQPLAAKTKILRCLKSWVYWLSQAAQ